MNEEKKIENAVVEDSKEEVKKRQINIETDGNNIFLVKNETAGKLELIAILQTLADFVKEAK